MGFTADASGKARLSGKIPQALRARMIFPRHPEGLTLLVRAGHELPLPVSYGNSATGVLQAGLFHKIRTGYYQPLLENAIFTFTSIKDLEA